MTTNYTDTLTKLQTQYQGALDEYTNTYVLHNTTPDNNEYTSLYFSSKATLSGLSAQLTDTVKSIQADISALNSSIGQTQQELTTATSKQHKLIHILDDINGNIRAADVMITDYKELYFIQYVSNITLYLGIIGAILIFRRVYA